MSVREDISRGQHIVSYSLDIWDRVTWKPVVSGTTIGSRRLDRFCNGLHDDASLLCFVMPDEALFPRHLAPQYGPWSKFDLNNTIKIKFICHGE